MVILLLVQTARFQIINMRKICHEVFAYNFTLFMIRHWRRQFSFEMIAAWNVMQFKYSVHFYICRFVTNSWAKIFVMLILCSSSGKERFPIEKCFCFSEAEDIQWRPCLFMYSPRCMFLRLLLVIGSDQELSVRGSRKLDGPTYRLLKKHLIDSRSFIDIFHFLCIKILTWKFKFCMSYLFLYLPQRKTLCFRIK